MKVKLDLKNLHRLQSKHRTALRKVLKQQSKAIQQRVKANAPKDTGALRYSIGTKVSVNKAGVAAIIGPRTKYKKIVKGQMKAPVRYAHFAEDVSRFLTRSLSTSDLSSLTAAIQTAVSSLLR